MSKLYLGSIDLSKINKSDIKTTDKDGNAFKNGAKYLDVAIWINDDAQEDWQQVGIKAGSKENSYYIGNAKEWKKQAQEGAQVTAQDNSDLPF